MKRTLQVLLVLVVGAWLFVAMATEPQPVLLPDTLYTLTTFDNPSREDWPAWVHERVALTAKGRLDDSLMSPETLEGLQRFLDGVRGGGCHKHFATMIRRQEFLDEDGELIGQDRILAEFSELVVRGAVRGHAGGFEYGQPGTLYKISVLEFLKGSSPFDSHYFFVNAGRVKIGGTEICVDSFVDNPPENIPEGTEVIVTVSRYQGGEYLDLYDHHPSRVLALPDEGYEGYAWPGFRRALDLDKTANLPQAAADWLEDALLLYGEPTNVRDEKNG